MIDRQRSQPKAIVIGLGSAIGGFVATRLKQSGWSVVGTARSGTRLECEFDKVIRCDLDDSESIDRGEKALRATSAGWSLLFVAAGTMQPIGKFFEIEASDWESAIKVNAFGPLRLLRSIWAVRSSDEPPTICFLAGGGTNNDFPNYSAYCVAKVLLIKLTELLQSEEPSSKFVIIGPGYVRTPIHEETISAGDAAGKNRERTRQLLGDPGTPLESIYQHVMSCHRGEIDQIGGRNFSTVHDDWERGSINQTISEYPGDAYRLRRFPYGNLQ